MTQYRTTTDENGDFSLDLPALEKGTYTMKAIFEGDSDAYGSEITKTLIIQGRAYAISIEANNEIIQSGDTTTLTLSFEDEDGDPVIEPGQTIKLYQEYVVSDIILTSDKDILSYADNDVATLTAKVKTSSGGIPVGVDVVFKKDGVLLDTVQTNTQGIATYSYTSTGAGDITFSAECDLSSEIFVVYDVIKFDNGTFASHNDIWNTTNTDVTRLSEYTELSEITSDTTAYCRTSIPTECIIEFEVKVTDGAASSFFMQLINISNTQRSGASINHCNSSIGTWTRVKLEISTTEMLITNLDNNLTYTRAVSGDDVSHFRFYTPSSITTIQFRNFKVY